MKILLCSHAFSPSIGGIETVSSILAERFHAAGHEVVVVTQTAAGKEEPPRPFRVFRQPTARALFDCVRRADVVFHNNVSLRMAWPLLLLRRPWVIAHHTWLPTAGRGAFAGRIKRLAAHFALNIAVSDAVARSLPVPCERVPNPYADAVFRRQPDVARTRDLIFVGRLVSDKGLDVLLAALALLARVGQRPSLTVVGSGPELETMHAAARTADIGAQVRFVGARSAAEVATLLNQHRAIVVPSVWEEPFGLVAIEAIACGCVPIVSRSGGLPEAIATHGVVFDKGRSEELAAAITRVLADEGARATMLQHTASHLARHRGEAVARAYLAVLERARGVVGDVLRT